MKKLSLFLLVSVLLCGGCVSQCPTPPSEPIAPAYQLQNHLESLKKGGVQVIQLGDELRLVLPSRRFFKNNTSTLKTTANRYLDEIVDFMNQRNSFAINVVAYTPALDPRYDFKPDVSLEGQQAQVIVDYLLQHGLNARLIAANAWRGVTNRQKQGTGCFSDDSLSVFSVEIRTRLIRP